MRRNLLLPLVFSLVWVPALALAAERKADKSGSLYGPDQLAKAVDDALDRRWKQERLVPSPPCTDHEFLRRVSLDLTGCIPSEDAVRKFAGAREPEKRENNKKLADHRKELVDQLMDSEGYGRHQSVVWGNALVGRGKELELLAQINFRNWLAEKLAKNTHFDDLVREMITATGRRSENAAAGWAIKQKGNHEDMAGSVARLFLGTQIQCAQCHDHPFDKWKQRDFYGMAAFFARVKYDNLLFVETVQDLSSGEIRLGGNSENEIIAPRFLAVEKPANLGSRPRREVLADWLVSRDNKQFAKATVNRVWAQFFGKGFVHPVDDFSENNPPSCPEALEALADGFVHSDFDLKFLVRAITRTKAYQLSSLPSKTNKDDDSLFSKHPLRRLIPEQMVPSVVMSSGITSNREVMENPVVKLILLAVEQQFIFVFSNMDEQTEVSEFKGTIAQALLMMNGKSVIGATRLHLLHPLALKLLQRSPDEQVEMLFLATVSRPPTKAELGMFVPAFRNARLPNERLEICEDLYWALINSAEFTFNH